MSDAAPGRGLVLGLVASLLGAPLLASCGDARVLTGEDSETDASTGTPVTTGTSTLTSASSTGTDPVCTPGTTRCTDDDVLETCDASGEAWTPEVCSADARCIPCEGTECSSARCQDPCEVAAERPSSAGCSFIASHAVHLYDDFPEAIVLANPGEADEASVQIYEVPFGESEEVLFEELTIGAGEVRGPIELPRSSVPCCSTLITRGGFFRIRSDRPISVVQHGPSQANLGNESSTLLPDEALGTQYVAASAPESFVCGTSCLRGPSYFQVVALEDGTQVSWTPRVAPTDGNFATIDPVDVGQTGTIGLNRHDTLRIVTSVMNVDENDPEWNLALEVSGTVIESDKPIWVLGGAQISVVPFSNGGTGDPLQEVLFPVSTWGTRYVAPAPPQRNADSQERGYWRLYAGADAVTVTSDPPLPGFPVMLLERGAFVDVVIDFGQHTVFEGDGPFLPVQYLRSRSISPALASQEGIAPNLPHGDPAMVQMVPTDRFLEAYAFATGTGFAFDFVQLIRSQGGPDVVLDGTVVTDFVPAGSEFEVATLTIEDGAHTATSDAPFGMLQFGWALALPGSDTGCIRNEDQIIDGQTYPAATCNTAYAHPGGLDAG